MSQTTSITAASTTRQFEAFIRSIPKVKTLGEARRLRADIEREQRLAKVGLESERRDQHDKTAEVSLKRAKRYSKRLERARLEIDARIATLSNMNGKVCNIHVSRLLLTVAIKSIAKPAIKRSNCHVLKPD